MGSKHDECFKGCFSLRVSTCLFIFTLCGRITGALIEPVKVTVKEGSDAILPCSLSTNENIESNLFDWKKDGRKEVFLYNAGHHDNNGFSDSQDRQFRGRVFHFQDELKHGNASIIIRNTTAADSGNYTCVFPRLPLFHIELVVVESVLKRRNISGAAPEPSVTIIDETNDWSLLQCAVRGAFPEPKVEWKDSSGNIVPAEEPKVTKRGDKYDVILNATVTKTDHYHCVATQKEILHQIDSKIFVHINGPPTGWIVAVSFLSILLLVSVVGNVLFAKGRRRHENGSGNPPVSHHENGVHLRTEPLLPGSDVPAQQTSPV